MDMDGLPEMGVFKEWAWRCEMCHVRSFGSSKKRAKKRFKRHMGSMEHGTAEQKWVTERLVSSSLRSPQTE